MAKKKTKKYKVKQGDTLFNLAIKFYGDSNKADQIIKDNDLKTTFLVPGEELKIRTEGDESNKS